MLTGKKNVTPTSPSKAERDALVAELAYHEESAAALERQGNTGTYHHERAAAIRAALNLSDEVNQDGKLD